VKRLALIGLLAVAACVTAEAGDRHIEVAPDRATFPPVSDLLDRRCGTLDCHGVSFRNLRLYGHEGLRLDPDAGAASRPSSLPNTTAAEYDANFASLVGLEPETMTAVVEAKGAQPERLTFIRKARGTEDHKGQQLWTEGDVADKCVTSWLAGATDTASCTTALAAP
jgi:hypothetical protein